MFNESLDPKEPGVAIMVAYDGKRFIGKGFGISNIETKEPITKSTNMEMAYVSKQFTDLTV